MKQRRWFSLWFALCAIAFVPIAVNAQEFYGTIRGVVTDPSGAAVAGADVTAVNMGTNAGYPVKTNTQGEYVVPELPAGMYEIHVKQSGFRDYVLKRVEVHGSSTTDANVPMQMGTASETITVEGTAVQVQTSSAGIGEVVDGNQVRELPLNGGNFVQLLLLQPGVSGVSSAGTAFNTRDKG